MAHLDLDTAALLTASARMRRAASLLEGLGNGTPDGTPAGDVALTDAIEQVSSAWSSTQGFLVAELDGLASSLVQTADTFEAAEGLTTDRLAALLHPDGSR
jgi:hypothetical protein